VNKSGRTERLNGVIFRWLVLSVIGLSTGCQSTGPWKRLAKSTESTNSLTHSVPVSEPIEGALNSDVTAVKPVVFDQSLIGSIGVVTPIAIENDSVAFQSEEAGKHVMTLADFESLALSSNPTIAELSATTQKAAGYRTQVGLRANPTIGYSGMQLADEGTDQHVGFISQTIVTGDKLQLNRQVLNESLRAQLFHLESQKYRVATDLRVKFYDALAAQRRVKLIQDFRSVVDKGLELAELRKKAQEGSQLDIVQAKVQKNEIELALQQAEISFAAAWRELAAIVGRPDMQAVELSGVLPEDEDPMDWAAIASTMIGSSPEYQAAQARVSQAMANIRRQCAQPIPNLDLQLGAGVDNATDSGMLNVQVGAPIPVFNRNQGNIAAARAELQRASREVERIENSIKARLAAVSRDYDSSLAAVNKYTRDILPNARQGLELADAAYDVGETSFVQVLVARKSYFDTNLQFIASQTLLAQARARLDGYVLSGSLDPVEDNSGDDSLRGLTFSQQ